jgi:hypothetical protein
MKERPILFGGAMVRALLAGSKTQTRRVAKLPHNNRLGQWEPTTIGGENGGRTAAGETVPLQGAIWHTRTGDSLMCPHGQPSDRLWVRETFYCDNAFYPNGVGVSAMWREVDGQRTLIPIDEQRAEMLTENMYYRADGEPHFEGAEGKTPWRPSIHMPRWASRITLEVTGVRVERLRDISEADARAEGIELLNGRYTFNGGLHESRSARDAYQALWDSLNAARGYGWDVNPWVWVVEFRRVAG